MLQKEFNHKAPRPSNILAPHVWLSDISLQLIQWVRLASQNMLTITITLTNSDLCTGHTGMWLLYRVLILVWSLQRCSMWPVVTSDIRLTWIRLKMAQQCRLYLIQSAEHGDMRTYKESSWNSQWKVKLSSCSLSCHFPPSNIVSFSHFLIICLCCRLGLVTAVQISVWCLQSRHELRDSLVTRDTWHDSIAPTWHPYITLATSVTTRPGLVPLFLSCSVANMFHVKLWDSSRGFM